MAQPQHGQGKNNKIYMNFIHRFSFVHNNKEQEEEKHKRQKTRLVKYIYRMPSCDVRLQPYPDDCRLLL